MSLEFRIWLDGAPASALPLPDRGLQFGDGLFETLLLDRGQPLFPQLHMQRLATGLVTLGIPDCVAAVLEQLQGVAQELSATDWRWAALRVTVTRGDGPRGYAPPQNASPRIVMQATPLEWDCRLLQAPANLCLVSLQLSEQPLLAGLKHLNRLEQVMAADEVSRSSADEGLLLSGSGRVVSVVAGNIFVVRDQILYTPPIDSCGVAGTRRRLLLDKLASDVGVIIKEQHLSLDDLATASELFYSNSLVGFRPVAVLGESRWDEFPLCEQLFEAYLNSWR